MTRIAGTLHEDQYIFLIISRSVLLRMKNVSNKSCRENQNTHLTPNNFFFENFTVYEIKWENITDPDRPRMTTGSIRIACWIPTATNTHLQYMIPYLLLFHYNNGCTNAPQCYITRRLLVVLSRPHRDSIHGSSSS